jgi:hypothetical protein
VFYIMHRHFHDNEPCLDVVRKLYKLFRVADTTAASCLQAAFGLVGDHGDAVVDETAKGIGADRIVERSVGDLKNSAVPAITPSGLMGLVGQRAGGVGQTRPIHAVRAPPGDTSHESQAAPGRLRLTRPKGGLAGTGPS